MRFVPTSLLSAALACLVGAADVSRTCGAPLVPPEAVVAKGAESPTIDEAFEKLAALEKQRAEIEAQIATLKADLKAQFKALQEKYRKHGLLDDVTPPKPPPKPVDPLEAKLRVAFEGDSAALDIRKSQAKDLAALYRMCVDLSSDKGISTSGELLIKVSQAATTMLKDPPKPMKRNLDAVRLAVAEELGKLLPTDEALSDAQRVSVAALFAKLAGVLETLGG